MPNYEYRCKVCGYRLELIRPVKDRDKPVYCDWEQCPGILDKHPPAYAEMRRVLSAPAMHPDSTWNQ